MGTQGAKGGGNGGRGPVGGPKASRQGEGPRGASRLDPSHVKETMKKDRVATKKGSKGTKKGA